MDNSPGEGGRSRKYNYFDNPSIFGAHNKHAYIIMHVRFRTTACHARIRT